MIHICNKIYISYAETSVGPSYLSRLPESFVRMIDMGLSFMHEELYDKEQVAYGKTVTEVLDQFESEEMFFKTLMDRISSKKSPKVIIYADKHAMLEFLIRWWKAIFPGLTAEGGYALYKVFADAETLRPAKSTESFLDITVKSDRISFDKFAFDYWSESKHMFMDKFNSYPAFQLPLYMKHQASIEFLTMDYMLDTTQINPYLVSHLTNYYERVFATQLYTLTRKIQHHLYYLASLDENLMGGAMLDGTSIKDTLQLDSRYPFFFNYEIQDSRKSFQYVKDNFEMQKVCQDLIDVVFKCTENIGIDLHNIETDDPCVAYYAKNGKHPDIIEEVLNDEIWGHSKFKFFHRLVYKNRFNPFIIPAFRNLIAVKGKDDPFVQQFKLAQV